MPGPSKVSNELDCNAKFLLCSVVDGVSYIEARDEKFQIISVFQRNAKGAYEKAGDDYIPCFERLKKETAATLG